MGTLAVKKRIVIAGASGFVGKPLVERLALQHEVIALGRRAPEEMPENVVWRVCHLESLDETVQALKGANVGVYLVHSMSPKANLVQGNFREIDLLCADNFARAAKKAGLERIVYLGGLTEDGRELSEHLESRKEVERALGHYGTPVYALRAGMVIGEGGSSFDILLKLVERLPAMIIPKWGMSRTQPIALTDIVDILTYTLTQTKRPPGAYDVGAPEAMTYREMLDKMAQLMGRHPKMIPLTFDVPVVSLLWVSGITGTPRQLVLPLLESLHYDMVAKNKVMQEDAGVVGKHFEEMVTEALAERKAKAATHAEAPKRAPRSEHEEASHAKEKKRAAKTVLSVQRIGISYKADARELPFQYFDWLVGAAVPNLRLETTKDGKISVFFRPFKKSILAFEEDRESSSADRLVLRITGGLLVADGTRGTFEFRIVDKAVLIVLDEFSPRLPFRLYAATQARVHTFVMNAFRKHLSKLSGIPMHHINSKQPLELAAKAESPVPASARG